MKKPWGKWTHLPIHIRVYHIAMTHTHTQTHKHVYACTHTHTYKVMMEITDRQLPVKTK